jgi:prephenate dehydrogenase
MAKKSLVVGGAGALGRSVINVFKNKGWKVASMDFVNHDKADANVHLDS